MGGGCEGSSPRNRNEKDTTIINISPRAAIAFWVLLGVGVLQGSYLSECQMKVQPASPALGPLLPVCLGDDDVWQVVKKAQMTSLLGQLTVNFMFF